MIPGLSAYADDGPSAIVDGGYYCKTPDNRPLIGPTAIDGVYLLGALSGFGIMASQAAAELLAAHVLDHTAPRLRRRVSSRALPGSSVLACAGVTRPEIRTALTLSPERNYLARLHA